MDGNVVVEAISNITFGTVLAWFTGILAIFFSLTAIVRKIYKAFERYHRVQEQNTILKNTVDTHGSEIANVNEMLKSIQKTLDEQRIRELKKLRHSIVRAGEAAISKDSITIRELQSLEELYDDYSNVFKENGYVKTLMEKVRDLNVIGTIEEVEH